MKIVFQTPVVEDDGTRTGLTVDHLVLYPGGLIVINGKSGISKSIDYSKMSATGKKALDDFLLALANEAK